MGYGYGGGNGGGGAGARPVTRTVPAATTGALTTMARKLASTSVFSLITGSNANLAIGSSTGVISATTGIAEGASQTAYVREEIAASHLAVEYPVTLTGAVVLTAPAAPSLTATAGNGQVTLTWTDGSNGGAAITAHKLYGGTVSGSLTLIGTIMTGSPYVVTGLTNGDPYYYKLSAVNSIGESALSTEQSATPSEVEVIIAILTGQSNMNGRNTNDGLSVDRANKFAYDNDSYNTSPPTYQTILSTTTALNHPEHLDRTGPDDQILDDLAVAYPGSIVIGVPCCVGGTGFASSGNGFYPGADAGSSGGDYNGMITAATNAVTLAQAAYPGCTITPYMFIQFGENEASSGLTRAQYSTATQNYISYARSRLAAATSVSAFSTMKAVIGMPIAEKWFGGGGYVTAGQQTVIAAFVDATRALSNVYLVAKALATPASDHLHYQPADVARTQGAAHLPAMSRTDFPTITTPSTYTSGVGSQLSVSITHNQQSNADHLVTAEIAGGADAAEFEIDDQYGAGNIYDPKLRWVGDGTGPAAGDYAVQVALRNSAGVLGTPDTLTVTASAEVSPVTFFTAGEKGQVWDLTDFANMSQTIDGATPVTAYGQYVGWLKDLSPNAAHFVAVANDTKRPTIEQDADGKPYLNFAPPNSSTFHQLISPIPFIGTTDARSTAVCGLYGAAPGYDGWIITADNPSSNPPKFYPFKAKTTGAIAPEMTNDASGGGGTMPSVSGFLNSTKRMASFQYNGSNNFVRVRDDANRPAWQSVTQGTFSNTLTVTRTRMCVLFQGRMYSGFTISRVLSDSDLTAGENWAASRCLTSALP